MPLDPAILEIANNYQGTGEDSLFPELDPYVLGIINETEVATSKRKKELTEKYAWKLIDPSPWVRARTVERVTDDLKDPTDRELLTQAVYELAQKQDKARQFEHEQKGIAGKAAEVGGAVAGQFGGGFIEAGEALKKAIWKAEGLVTPTEDLEFQAQLAAAKEGGYPEIPRYASYSRKVTEKTAGMLPDVMGGAGAAYAAGPAGGVAYWAARMQPEMSEQYQRMGLSPAASQALGMATAGIASVPALLAGEAAGLPGGFTKPLSTAIGGSIVKAFNEKGASALGKALLKRPEVATAILNTSGYLERVLGASTSMMLMGEVTKTGEVVASRIGPAENIPLMEIPRAGGKAFAETLGPMALLTAGTSAANLIEGPLSEARLNKINTEILKTYEEGKPVSRKQWKEWGFSKEITKQEDRNVLVTKAAEDYIRLVQQRLLATGTAPTSTQWKQWRMPENEGKTPETRLAYLKKKFGEEIPGLKEEIGELERLVRQENESDQSSAVERDMKNDTPQWDAKPASTEVEAQEREVSPTEQKLEAESPEAAVAPKNDTFSKLRKITGRGAEVLAGDYVQRYEEPGVERATFDKPHGIYTTPADIESPHKELGGKRFLWKKNESANVLDVSDVPNLPIRREGSDAGAGVHALYKLLGESEYIRLKTRSKKELIKELSEKYPDVQFERYYDKQEVLEAYGGLLARERGYDAINRIDINNPAFTEYIGLTSNAMSPLTKGTFLTEETAALAIGGRLRRGPATEDTIAGSKDIKAKFADPEIEATNVANYGLKPESQQLKWYNSLKKAWSLAIRTREFLPEHGKDGGMYDYAREVLRQARAIRPSVTDESARNIASYLKDLGTNQYGLFWRTIVARNEMMKVQRGEYLANGFKTREQVDAELSRLEALVAETPKVAKALQTRTEIAKTIVEDAVARNILPETALQNPEAYYHQQVHQHMTAKSKYATKQRKGKKGFQILRKKTKAGEIISDEGFDYNTNFIESEMEWITDTLQLIKTHDLIEPMLLSYHKNATAIAEEQARKASQESGREVSVDEIIEKSPDLDYFQKQPGNISYMAFSIPERLAEMLQKGIVKEYPLTSDELSQVLAIGGPHKKYVLPKPLADQLRSMEKVNIPNWFENMHADLMNKWKAFVLLNPKRVLSYNTRNLTGDIDPIVAADPTILKELPASIKELMGFHGLRAGEYDLKLSKMLSSARDKGVVSSGFFTYEVGDITSMPIFRRMGLSNVQDRSLVRIYMDHVRPFTELRENVLRYAAYRHYLKLFNSGKKLTHYGASKQRAIDNVRKTMGNEAAAAKLARELIGDYGNMTVAGEFIRRKLIPFWAFQEINCKRYPRLAINALKSGQGRGRTAAVVSAVAALRIGGLYAAMWAWNNLVMSGEEDLPPFDRANPHILLGHNADGSVRNFRNVGAMGDFMEWFGVNEALSMYKMYRNGQVGTKDIAQEMAKSPFEKAFNSLRPDIKAPFEFAMGVTLFPSVFAPRRKASEDVLVDVFGAGSEYHTIKQYLLGKADRAKPHYIQQMFIGVNDPRIGHLQDIYELRNRFLQKKGKEYIGIYPESKYKQALMAAQLEDQELFFKWQKDFLKDKTASEGWKGFKRFLGNIDPIASRLNERDEWEFNNKYLNQEQRNNLQQVREYSLDLRNLLAQWWFVGFQKRAD